MLFYTYYWLATDGSVPNQLWRDERIWSKCDDNLDTSFTMFVVGRLVDGSRYIHKIKNFQPYIYINTKDFNLLELENNISIYTRQRLNINLKKIHIGTSFETFAVAPTSYFSITATRARAIQDVIRYCRNHNISYYNHNDPITQYLGDNDLSYTGWVHIEENTGNLKSAIENDQNMPLLRIGTFDIEAYQERGFPDPDNLDSPCFLIALNYTVIADKELTDCKVIVLYYGRSIESKMLGKFTNATLVHCKDEKEVLLQFACKIIEQEVDILSGYNVDGFDWRYIFARTKVLGIEHEFRSILTVLQGGHARLDVIEFISKTGSKEFHCARIPGVITMDTMNFIKATYQLPNYKLATATDITLPANDKFRLKHDLPIKRLHSNYIENTAQGVAENIVYCITDVMICLRLLLFCDGYSTVAAKSNICCISPMAIMEKGLLAQGRALVPANAKKCNVYTSNNAFKGGVAEVKKAKHDNHFYQGGLNLPTKVGVQRNVVTLDFNSLYPNVMQEHNLCSSTYIPKEITDSMLNEHKIPFRVIEWTPVECKEKNCVTETTTYRTRFVRNEYRKGVVPRILGRCIRERKAVKKQMKIETNPATRAILNSKQLALKLIANGLYGSMNWSRCVTASTTAAGRAALRLVCDVVTGYAPSIPHVCWKDANAPNPGNPMIEVVGGDTDSCFLKFPDTFTKDTIIEYVTKILVPFVNNTVFPSPYMQMEFEKFCYKAIFFRNAEGSGIKKTYELHYWDASTGEDKTKPVGGVWNKRISCVALQTIAREIVNCFLHEKDEVLARTKAISAITTFYNKLLAKAIPLKDFTISTQLKKYYKGNKHIYNAKIEELPRLAHIQLARRMLERNKGSEPAIGDRIEFIYVDEEGRGKAKSDWAETVEWAQEHKLSLHTLNYVHQFSHSFRTIFGTCGGLEEFEVLHQNAIKYLTPKITKKRTIRQVAGQRKLNFEIKA